MMRWIFFILVTIITPELFAQGVVFNTTYNFGGSSVGGCLAVNENGYIVQTNLLTDTTYRALVASLDNEGTVLDSFQIIAFDSFGISIGNYTKNLNSDLFATIGYFQDSNLAVFPLVYFFNSQLEMQSIDTLNINGSFIDAKRYNNQYLIVGQAKINSGDRNFLLAKYDAEFNKLWDKTFGLPLKNEVAYSISQTHDGGYVMSGYRNHDNGDSNPYMVKTDSSGNFLWDKEFSLSELSEGAALSMVSTDGFIYLVGEKAYTKDNYTRSLTWLCKLNNNGSIVWQKEYGISPALITMVDISERQDGSILIAGNTTRITPRNPIGKMVGIIYNIDTAGNQIFEQYFMVNPDPNHDSLGYETHYVQSLDVTEDGGYVIAGFITELPGQDLWVVKFDSNGCYDPTFGGCVVGVEEYSDPSFQFSVWPNPASGLLHIETDSPILEIEVYSQLGELVSSNELVVGSKLEKLDVSEFKPGLYFLVVKTEKGVETKKFIKNE